MVGDGGQGPGPDSLTGSATEQADLNIRVGKALGRVKTGETSGGLYMNIFKSCIPLFALISAAFLNCPYSLAADLADLKNMPILPSQTDPNISSFDLPHMIWSPVGKGRGQLLVHLPGTGDQPHEDAETQEWKARAVPFIYANSNSAWIPCYLVDVSG